MDIDIDLSAIATVQLEDEVRQYAANIAAATCRWLLLIAELDRREAWKAWGARSCAHWLSWHCGVALLTGREHARVAAALRDLPATTGAFASGELSYTKVRALTRIARSETEVELVALARETTAAQLETIVRAYRRCATAELDAAKARHERRYLRWSYSDDGSLIVRARIPAEAAPIVEAGLERAVDALREGLPADTTVVPEQIAADGLVAVCEAALAGDFAARPGTERIVVNVLVNAETLAGDDADGICQIADGPALARATVRRFLCDSATVPVVEAVDGRPIAAGRMQRTCSRRQRRALLARRGKCRFPGCDHRRYLDIHHVVHWIDGGPTELANLAPLCWYHHRLVHEGGFTVVGSGHDLTFFGPDGRRIESRSARSCGRDVRGQFAVDGDNIVARGHGEPFDLGLTIDGLFGLDKNVSAETSKAATQGAAPNDASQTLTTSLSP